MSGGHIVTDWTTIPDIKSVRDSLNQIVDVKRKREFLNTVRVALVDWCRKNPRKGWGLGGLENHANELAEFIDGQLGLLAIRESIPRSAVTSTAEFEPIKWQGSERQLAFLFEELLARGLISETWDGDKIWSKISKMIVKKTGSAFDRKQLSNQKIQYLSNREGKPHGASDIESLLDQLNEIGSGDD